jgi:exodeoxyribonuclease V alpha subunit
MPDESGRRRRAFLQHRTAGCTQSRQRPQGRAIRNDYDKDVYNGDIGNIECINPADGELVANFDGRAVTYGFGELDMLVPAYATTIHKSQGSEYPAVVIPVMTQHYAMLQRNLLYTGVTRGKKLVVLVGQKKALAIAVRNVSGRRRWSKLQQWLRPNPSLSPQIGVASRDMGAQ